MATIAPLTTFMAGKQPPNKIPMKSVKTGVSTVDTKPKTPPPKKKGKRVSTVLS